MQFNLSFSLDIANKITYLFYVVKMCSWLFYQMPFSCFLCHMWVLIIKKIISCIAEHMNRYQPKWSCKCSHEIFCYSTSVLVIYNSSTIWHIYSIYRINNNHLIICCLMALYMPFMWSGLFLLYMSVCIPHKNNEEKIAFFLLQLIKW